MKKKNKILNNLLCSVFFFSKISLTISQKCLNNIHCFLKTCQQKKKKLDLIKVNSNTNNLFKSHIKAMKETSKQFKAKLWSC